MLIQILQLWDFHDKPSPHQQCWIGRSWEQARASRGSGVQGWKAVLWQHSVRGLLL